MSTATFLLIKPFVDVLIAIIVTFWLCSLLTEVFFLSVGAKTKFMSNDAQKELLWEIFLVKGKLNGQPVQSSPNENTAGTVQNI